MKALQLSIAVLAFLIIQTTARAGVNILVIGSTHTFSEGEKATCWACVLNEETAYNAAASL